MAFFNQNLSLQDAPRLLAAVLLAATLAACTAPVRGPAEETRLEQETAPLVAQGLYAEAARRYLTAADQTQGSEQARYRLMAAYWLIQTGEDHPAIQGAAALDDASVATQDQLLLAIVRARVALFDHRPDQALELLHGLPAPELDDPFLSDYHQVRADAYSMAGNRLESARERVWLAGLLADSGARIANQEAIWNDLSGLSNTALERMRTAPAPDVLSGWMELVQIGRAARVDVSRLATALEQWRLRYPDHPAEEYLLPRLLGQASEPLPAVDRLALLLPVSGSLAEPAAAVRDGILAARFAQLASTGAAPEVRVYDVGGGPHVVWSQYQQALLDGAQMVIGPLRKESVAALGRTGLLTIPVLALNRADIEEPLDNFYQFGLAPEDEARQVAQRARWDGHSGAIALIPQGAWGDRVLAAFQQQWQELDGELLEVQRYADNSADFGGPIRDALNLDSSRNRKRALVNLLGRNVEYEPRRRQDVDMVFLLAKPKQARQLRPQLRFHRAANLPVYSTSHVFTGTPNPARDRDMNGLRFCDMPWRLSPRESRPELRNALQQAWPDRMNRYANLYGLGIDAYELLPYIEQLGPAMFGYFNGVTGNLSVDAQGRLHRELAWARFERGTPAVMEAPLNVIETPVLQPTQPFQDGTTITPGATDEQTPAGTTLRTEGAALPGTPGTAADQP